MIVEYVTTPTLRIAYEISGPEDGAPVLLVHGWPDDARTFDRVLPALHAAGLRTIAPWLRGFGDTRFVSPEPRRTAQRVALVQDVLELADALGLARFAVVGHDWGAHVAYGLAALFPERITRIAALSIGWQPGPVQTPPFAQARRYWYHWFLATERGAAAFRADGAGFARLLWETWSPPGWYDEEAFAATARAFANPDWPDVTLHFYRYRWGLADADPRYAALEARAAAASTIAVPTLLVHGGADECVLPSASERTGEHVTGPYQRVVLDGVGHFPTREAPADVARLLTQFLDGSGLPA